MKRLWIVFAVLCTAVTVVVVGLQRYLASPLPIPSEGVAFKIAPGTSLTKVTEDLAANNLIPNAKVAALAARVWGIAPRIQAGEYHIVGPHTLRSLLEALTKGKSRPLKFTLVEGWTMRDVLRELNNNPHFMDEPALTRESVAARLGMELRELEGAFFPDTYFFDPGSSRYALLERARAKMKSELALATQGIDFHAEQSPFRNPYEFLILASIIEKETNDPRDRGKVASVFTNRMRIGMPLQSDPTVIYGLGDKFDGNLTRAHLQTDGEYNTYTRKGYPPTPICMPGRAAMRAAAHPEDTKYLYFVARGDGTSEFSEDLAAHNAAVAKYQLKR